MSRELYSPEWSTYLADGDKAPTRPSYCHPWASGVTAWLTHAVGGLRPSRPGYASYTASPYLGATVGVDSAVSASVGTPSGRPIKVSGSRSADGAATISVAADAPGHVGLRRVYSDGCTLVEESVAVDGVLVAAGPLAPEEVGTLHSLEHARHLWAPLPPGQHRVGARYSCPPPPSPAAGAAAGPGVAGRLEQFPPFPPPAYSGAGSALDTQTRGKWLGRYGSKGYVLLGFDSSNGTSAGSHDRVKLPDHVVGVTITQHGFQGLRPMPRVYLGRSASNASFLQDPADPSGSRGLGYSGQTPSDGSQGFLININSTVGVPLNVSVYCVGEYGRAAQAIRPMDLKTFSPVAPEPYFHDFQGGAWWTVSYTPPAQETGAYSGAGNNGLSLRIMGIYGMTVSAVTFD